MLMSDPLTRGALSQPDRANLSACDMVSYPIQLNRAPGHPEPREGSRALPPPGGFAMLSMTGIR